MRKVSYEECFNMRMTSIYKGPQYEDASICEVSQCAKDFDMRKTVSLYEISDRFAR